MNVESGSGNVETYAKKGPQCRFFCRQWPGITACQFTFATKKCIGFTHTQGNDNKIVGDDTPHIKCYAFGGRFYLAKNQIDTLFS